MPPTFPHAYLFHEVSIELATAKRAAGRCVSWRCRRRAAHKKNGRCNTCASRLFRISNDTYYAYSNLKASAAKRGIGFELSFDEFVLFCAVTDYLARRGKDPTSLTVDRRKTDQPYRADNIRIMEYHDNISHRHEQVSAHEPAEF